MSNSRRSAAGTRASAAALSAAATTVPAALTISRSRPRGRRGARAGRSRPARPWARLLIALSLFTTQVLLSRWRLSRHQYGPVEWLLRAATH
ncbi:DUF418 domain-containing protein [Nonomuraea dietziae]|uniref:DUF418 domain-containing protein n=1 Tax=Nonomuraea dietziae TaxID=65515 RepID=UPI003442DBA8